MKKSKILFVLALTVSSLLVFTNSAAATPITYVQSGTASGSIGGVPFTNALVTVTLVSDTSNVTTIDPNFPTVRVVYGNSSVNITGVGTATITDPTRIISTGIAVPIEPGAPILPYVFIETINQAMDDFGIS